MIAITGGSGFIGAHLCEAIAKQTGSKPINIDINEPTSTRHCIYKKADVKNPPEMLAATVGVQTLFHLAAQISVQKSIENPAEDFETNAQGTLNALEACRKNNVRTFVYASSAAIYGTPKYSPIDEAHPTEPLSPYGFSKLAGELMCSRYASLYGIKTVRLRFFNVYGKGQSPSSPYSGVITKFATRIKSSEPPIIFGSGAQTRAFVHASDAGAACIFAAESKNTSGNAYNIGTGKETSILSLANVMIKISGKNISVQHKSALEGEIEKSVADVSVAKKDFGFSPRITLEEGLKGLL